VRENKSFLLVHSALLAVVLVGFGRSFYLRPLFSHRPLDLPLTVHGLILTCWFSLTVAQAFLINAGQRHWHRRIAWLAVLVAAGVVASAMWINTRLATHLKSPADGENMFIWGNYMSLAAFVALLYLGVSSRKRPDAHRRLVLFASIMIVGPAFARFAFWPLFGANPGAAPAFAGGGILLAIAAAIAVDLRAAGRIHPATTRGIATFVGVAIIGFGLGFSGLGYELLHRLQVIQPANVSSAVATMP
jgi:hypothetical protein